jgi:hypothetical protein
MSKGWVTKLFRFYLIVAVLGACNVPEQGVSSSSPVRDLQRAPTPQQIATPEVNPLLIGLEGGLPRGREAWESFTADSRYRVARASDFNFSEAAMRSGGVDLKKGLLFPYMTGDIDRDYRSRDVAVIIVDTKRNDAERFGLIIFTEPEDGDSGSIPQPYWLYRDRDLSRTLLSWDSEGLNLRTYHDDGSFTMCRVRWNRKQQQYLCN